MRVRAAVSMVAAAILSAAAQGCGNRAATEPALGVVPVINGYSDVRFPLDEHTMPMAQRETLNTAAHMVVRACAERFGFHYAIPPQPKDEPGDRVIGLIDESEAARFGYKNPLAQQHARQAAEERAAQQRSPQPEAYAHVLKGSSAPHNGMAVPAGGCYGEARRALESADSSSGGVAADNFMARLAGQSSRQAESDSRLREAFRDWSACMADAGFSYGDPWAANDDPAFRGESPSPVEIATAQTDVRCRKSSNVNGTWVAVRSAYQNVLISQNSEALRRHRQATDEQLKKATAIITAAK